MSHYLLYESYETDTSGSKRNVAFHFQKGTSLKYDNPHKFDSVGRMASEFSKRISNKDTYRTILDQHRLIDGVIHHRAHLSDSDMVDIVTNQVLRALGKQQF